MTAHVADSQRSQRPAVQRQALAQIAKGNGLGFVEWTDGYVMDSATIDSTHTRAICDEIGERLRTLLRSPMPEDKPEDKEEFEDKLDRLSAIEAKSAVDH
jgi:hypothetical protein